MDPNQKLRLEYLDAEQLADNPSNWRTHNDGQLSALKDIIADVGWAGALLYNERTKRLIDGHARKKIVEGKVPVLIGDWSEEEEQKILVTLDPLAAMAETNKDALGKLLANVQTDSDALNKMLEGMAVQNGIDVFEMPADADGKEFNESCADDVEMMKCPSCGHKFPK